MGLFCENAKNEMLAVPLHSRKEKTAFLSAIFRSSAAIEIAGGERGFVLRPYNLLCKEVIAKTLDELYRVGQCEDGRTRIRVGGAAFASIAVDLKVFRKVSLADGSEELVYESSVDSAFLTGSRVRAAYMRGLFLAAGSVTISKGYHLEFGFTNGFLAEACLELFVENGFRAASILHKDRTVVYFKGSETVSDVLAFLGAPKAVLELNDVYARRATDKLTNRRINCDIANIDKTVAAAEGHMEAIRRLTESGRLQNLPKKLRETAKVRLAYPEASLMALSERLGITKSGLRHRLERLLAAAKEDEGV